MHKGEWNQRGLLPVDVDGDGRTDLVYINNEKARVEILLQRQPGAAVPRRGGRVEGRDRWTPVLEDSRFTPAPLTTATFMYDVAAGDLDGDGRADLVVSEKTQGLRLYLQRPDGEWRDPLAVELKGVVTYLGLLHVRDTDGNGRPEVIASTSKALHFFEWDGRALRPVRKLDHSEENLHGLRFVDLDRDGRVDLQLCSTDREYGLRVGNVFHAGDGGFGVDADGAETGGAEGGCGGQACDAAAGDQDVGGFAHGVTPFALPTDTPAAREGEATK